jgi:hypothetical protein
VEDFVPQLSLFVLARYWVLKGLGIRMG